MPWLWAVFTVVASGGQAVRNAMQKELTATLGTVGATHVRFLFGLPFALLFLAIVLAATGLPIPELNAVMIAWTVTATIAQFAATALLLVAIAIAIVEAIIGTAPLLGMLYALGVFIPSLAVAVRRLHDTNRSGWWLLIGLIPVIGLIVLIVFFVQDSDKVDNDYGANPKAGMAAA